MSKKVVLLENITGVAQNVSDDNAVVYTLPAHSKYPFEEEIASLFLSERGKFVRIYTPVEIPPPRSVGEPMVWIANLTGDPDAKPTIELTDTVKGQPTVVSYPHACYEARDLVYSIHVDQTRSIDASGLPYYMNNMPVRVKLPAYERFYVPKHVADFVIGRAALMREFGMPVGPCRAPTNFEANPTWSIDDLWDYARLLDATKFNDAFEAKLCQEVDKSVKTLAAVQQSFPGKLAVVKQELWKHIFFRLVNEEYSLPKEAVFRTVQHRNKPAPVEAAAEPVKRGPGRPPSKKSASEEMLDNL